MSTQQQTSGQAAPAVTTQAPAPAPADEFKKLLEKTHRPAGVFEDAGQFAHAQRVALMLVESPLVPEQFRGKLNVGSAVIAVDIAFRLNLNPLLVMQQLYIVYGKPAWSAQFVIATINSSGLFQRLKFELNGQGDERGCVCFTKDLQSGEMLRGSKVDVALAKKNGWWDRKDKNGNPSSHWPKLTDQMLMYRAASFWGRAYAPELLMGLPTVEEVQDSGYEEPAPSKPIFSEPAKPEAAPKTATPRKKAEPKAETKAPAPETKPAEPETKQPVPETKAPAAATPEQKPAVLSEAGSPAGGFNPIKATRMLLKQLKMDEQFLIEFWKSIEAVTGEPQTLEEVHLANNAIIQGTLDQWDDVSHRLIEAKQFVNEERSTGEAE